MFTYDLSLLNTAPRRLQTFAEIGNDIGHPELPDLIAQFVYQQRNPEVINIPQNCPQILEKAYSYTSAVARFYAPSDHCGVGGMQCQRIHANSSWRNGAPRYDCVFVEKDPALAGFHGLFIAQVMLFFSFSHRNVFYPCAFVQWFDVIGEHPCPHTGMWMVEPECDEDGDRVVSVIHLDSIMQPAHLIGVYGRDPLPSNLKHTDSLSAFAAFYVNKFSDYHAFQLAF